MKTAILSNVNLDMLCASVAKKHELFGTEGYGQWVSYALQKNAELESFDPKIIFLLLDGGALFETCEGLEDGLTEIGKSMGYIRALADNYPSSTVAVSTVDVPRKRLRPLCGVSPESEWEHEWSAALRGIDRKNVIPFELKELITDTGRNAFCSDKMWYMGSIPYGIKAVPLLAAAIDDFAARFCAVRRKVLVCDLDNTLWGGVCGEDGPEGITLGGSLIGAAYRDAQKRIREIAATGVLLAVVSKNNPEDVDAVFVRNPHMVLKKEDFVSIIANWKPKSENIRALAEELNLGLDSFVFWDDNEVERAEVTAALPGVTAAEFPKDPAGLPAAVAEMYRRYFFCVRSTDEDEKKTEQYRGEAQRRRAMAESVSMDDYLRSLGIKIVMGEVTPAQYERTVQLINKTNQFNTATLRMDMQQFTEFLRGEQNRVYTAQVSDIYGDSGLVVVLVLRREGGAAVIENMLMSCRVMGRQIENAVIHALGERLCAEGVETIRASYVRSAKNKPVEELWDRLGFAVVSASEDAKTYELSLPAQTTALLGVEWR